MSQQFRWVCLVPTVLNGRSYAQGDVWDGSGKETPVGKTSWTPVGLASDTPPVPPAPVEVEKPKEPFPFCEWDSDEHAQKSRADLAAWRARNP